MITNKNTRECLKAYFKELPAQLNYQLLCESQFKGLPKETMLWIESITITEMIEPVPIKQSFLQRLRSTLKKWFHMIFGFEKIKEGR